MAGRFGGLSVPLRRAARKFNGWLAVSAAKSLALPPQRVGAHRAAFIRAHLDPDPLPHLLPLALLMRAQVARVAGQSCHCQPHTGLNFSRRLLRDFPQSALCDVRRRGGLGTAWERHKQSGATYHINCNTPHHPAGYRQEAEGRDWLTVTLPPA